MEYNSMYQSIWLPQWDKNLSNIYIYLIETKTYIYLYQKYHSPRHKYMLRSLNLGHKKLVQVRLRMRNITSASKILLTWYLWNSATQWNTWRPKFGVTGDSIRDRRACNLLKVCSCNKVPTYSMQLIMQVCILKYKVENSQTNATIVNLHLLIKAFWGNMQLVKSVLLQQGTNSWHCNLCKTQTQHCTLESKLWSSSFCKLFYHVQTIMTVMSMGNIVLHCKCYMCTKISSTYLTFWTETDIW